ncbi:MAG: spermidine synthase [Saprospiraceae bacterium]
MQRLICPLSAKRSSKKKIIKPIQPPFWKKILSYLFEFHVESAPSEINPHLYVSLSRGRYQLSTANAIYSFEDLYDNFFDAFKKVHLDQYPIKNVLVLGLGLGSIPLMLEKNFEKKYNYTAVEIDESVIYLASKYTLPQLESNIQMICADAFAYVMQTEQKFDLICMDVFLDDVVPEEFEENDFLEKLKSLVNDDGILLFNRLASQPKDVERTKVFYHKNFKAVFPEGSYLEVKGNWMLINLTVNG